MPDDVRLIEAEPVRLSPEGFAGLEEWLSRHSVEMACVGLDARQLYRSDTDFSEWLAEHAGLIVVLDDETGHVEVTPDDWTSSLAAQLILAGLAKLADGAPTWWVYLDRNAPQRLVAEIFADGKYWACPVTALTEHGIRSLLQAQQQIQRLGEGLDDVDRLLTTALAGIAPPAVASATDDLAPIND